MKSDITSVLVTGDIIIDRHIYEGDRGVLQDQSTQGTHLVAEPGGAALTQQLIAAVFDADLEERRELWQREVEKAAKESNPRPPVPTGMCKLACKLPGEGWPERLTGYAWWAPYSRQTGKDKVWRVSRSFGYGSPDVLHDTAASIPETPRLLQAANDLPSNPGILVLDDAGDDFRRKDHQALWHLPVGDGVRTSELPTWIILKLAGPIGQGDLWDCLMNSEPGKRLIIVVSARVLRQSDLRLSSGLSWERTIEHLRIGLSENPAVAPLCNARHLIVHFEGDGAVWIDFSNQKPDARVVFDAEHAEGEWASRIEGEAFGYTSCLTAAVVHTLASTDSNKNDPDFQSSIERGLAAMRNLREEGHGVAIPDKVVSQPGRGFPAVRLATEILHPTHRFARAVIPWGELSASSTDESDWGRGAPDTSEGHRSQWSILAALQNPSAPTRPLHGFARQLAIRGESVLDHVPHLHIAKLLTADRQDMETLRALRRILEAYRSIVSRKKPLSIGVFGAPGAGKSFGVEQLALGIFGDPGKKSYDGWMEFNLSQFDEPKDLIGAFHQVRDRVLQGLIPVVFWDEFDSREYHWLQYLLAPMQDGRFQEGQITHTLGRCVFIFAGGTAESFEVFGPKQDGTEEIKQQQFKLAKGPDFKSRLDGYLNVLGPNQRRLPDAVEPRPKDETDIFFPVRRALMIRNILDCKRDERLDIDSGLLTALLEINDYKHGARSLSKVLEPFSTARKESRARLRRSQLPASNQLSLHVNDIYFYTLCSRDEPFKAAEIIQKLAPAVHEAWRKIAGAEGWKLRYDDPFDELPADMKRSNEKAARRIPDILALVGLKVVEGLASQEEDKLVEDHLERQIEALAEEEHKGWMDHREAEGWKFAETRDDDQRHHDCLRPFHELRESDKEKDRNSVRHFPDVVREGGFKIVFI